MLSHKYLICLGTGKRIQDDGLILSNPDSENPAFLRADYYKKEFSVRENLPGIYRYSDWLPISRILNGSSAPVTYHGRDLGKYLGLPNLYITFSGYWPEKGVSMLTGTFKECEAYSVCARFPEDSSNALVVASAGNTARAFMKVGSENGIPIIIVIPEKYINNLWYTGELNSCVKVVAAGGDSDYYDAIRLADQICRAGFYSEGGAKNVARRDGMGTTVLSAVETMGDIPDFYFQAIGSGTGAIAAHEANLRLIRDGKYGEKIMSLQLSQNIPFTPIYDAWKAHSNIITEIDEKEAYDKINKINAKVLSNRNPPYSIIGGLYDCLKSSSGDVSAVPNEEGLKAQKLFLELEGCDICPESGIALASLIQKVRNENLPKDAKIMLNITGGGLHMLAKVFKTKSVKPDLVIQKEEFDIEYIRTKIKELFQSKRNEV